MRLPRDTRPPGMQVYGSVVGGDVSLHQVNHFHRDPPPARRNYARILSWFLLVVCVVSAVLHIWLSRGPEAGSLFHAITHFPNPLTQQILLVVCAAALAVDAAVTRGFGETGGAAKIPHRVVLGVSLIAVAPTLALLAIAGSVLLIVALVIYAVRRLNRVGDSAVNSLEKFLK